MPASTDTLTNVPELTVSELSSDIKRMVEDKFGYVRLRGEVSGFRGPHSSGHCYFALKDENAKIEAVIWKGVYGRLRFKPEEGLEVIATGKVTTYPGASKYQIVIDAIEPAGAGALMALLEERRKKLAAEGLFDEARKKPLPYLPRVIGVVTSPTGAVIRDILHRLSDRCPCRVLVWPVRVQGETAAEEIAKAIAGFNALKPGGAIPRPDVLIVARGGGSLEDLWSFNEEIVVRAAAASGIPLISAVGHETDFTLIDFAADRRAPTPTAAAEMAVPVRAELLAGIRTVGARLNGAEIRLIERLRSEVRGLARGLPSADNVLALPRQRLDSLAERLPRSLRANAHRFRLRHERAAAAHTPRALRTHIRHMREQVAALGGRSERAARVFLRARKAHFEAARQLLNAFSYQEVLKRGFALVRDADGRPIRKAAGIVPGDRLQIEMSDGRLDAVVEGQGSTVPAKPGRRKADKGGQGSLFG